MTLCFAVKLPRQALKIVAKKVGQFFPAYWRKLKGGVGFVAFSSASLIELVGGRKEILPAHGAVLVAVLVWEKKKKKS